MPYICRAVVKWQKYTETETILLIIKFLCSKSSPLSSACEKPLLWPLFEFRPSDNTGAVRSFSFPTGLLVTPLFVSEPKRLKT